MSRKITIYKWKGNTSYSVDVEDSYGTVHHVGYYKCANLDELTSIEEIEMKAEEIWNNEVKPKEDLLGNAIKECIQSDIDRGVKPSLD